MRVVRFGIVGAGTIAQRGILPHLSQDDVQDRVVLAAVCDPVPGRAEAAARRFGIPYPTTDYEDLLANGDVDAVSIASPIGLHFAQGKLALEAGKHVHFNKTMTTTAAEATELIDLAAARDLRIVASPGEILRPQVQAVKRAIAAGAIGTPTWAIAGAAFGTYHLNEKERQGDGAQSAIDPSWYFRKPGGGPLYDMTVYALHGLTTVLGPARRVTAISGVRIPEREFNGARVPTDADDNTGILIDFGDGLFAVAYGAAAGGINYWFSGTYFGTGGTIAGFDLNGTPLDYPEKAVADEVGGGVAGAQATLPHVVGPHREIEEAHVFEDIMQLADWVRDGKASPVTAEHARHVIEIIEAAYRASETGQTQILTTTFR
ncbi:MAG: Myo-inositol 2-dehydrogenase [uncultured Thermomicrobiales bacterium]|uniref:Myo-inositol 2-dehydrogenase n=1 Tax=uncultured Thermomicrobiales bacterium TaxID=1645740 RepID=A0A6J4VAP6_9BACT|nr:MAG: Myo-inositol 2-dehydrogenase [uncultured Thermomicrobiales bacterium]